MRHNQYITEARGLSTSRFGLKTLYLHCFARRSDVQRHEAYVGGGKRRNAALLGGNQKQNFDGAGADGADKRRYGDRGLEFSCTRRVIEGAV